METERQEEERLALEDQKERDRLALMEEQRPEVADSQPYGSRLHGQSDTYLLPECPDVTPVCTEAEIVEHQVPWDAAVTPVETHPVWDGSGNRPVCLDDRAHASVEGSESGDEYPDGFPSAKRKAGWSMKHSVLVVVALVVLAVTGIVLKNMLFSDPVAPVGSMQLEFDIPAYSLTLAIPAVESAGAYSATIYWGDNSNTEVTGYDSSGLTHTYSSAGTYSVFIAGVFPGIRFPDSDAGVKLTRVLSLGETGLTTLLGAFWGCTALTSVAGVAGLETVTDMTGIFGGCTALTTLDLSGWDTSSVTSMGMMFDGCTALTTVVLSGWDTSSVTNMSYVFYRHCSHHPRPLRVGHLKCHYHVLHVLSVQRSYLPGPLRVGDL
ncbi:protein of unknown function DUF285 [Kipferlia bialata]|uniref:PKD domain-containing protein n=1 Tax=Kipferlia bialata TaxID=797122 RepID=A0A9K3D0H8_9EUKA|nr:protein of unknown function DUF285 [Kipferlia bialata]|eukprot:g8765.t1